MNTNPRPIGIQQRRGVALPPNTRSVARPSRWGNPHHSAPTPTARAHAVHLYRQWITTRPDLIDAAHRELTGKNLACYCPTDQPCHRDVLLDLLTTPEDNTEGNAA